MLGEQTKGGLRCCGRLGLVDGPVLLSLVGRVLGDTSPDNLIFMNLEKMHAYIFFLCEEFGYMRLELPLGAEIAEPF